MFIGGRGRGASWIIAWARGTRRDLVGPGQHRVGRARRCAFQRGLLPCVAPDKIARYFPAVRPYPRWYGRETWAACAVLLAIRSIDFQPALGLDYRPAGFAASLC